MALPSTILEKHFPTPDGHPDTEAIISAMEEYASEWKVKYDELKAENEAKNLLIKSQQDTITMHVQRFDDCLKTATHRASEHAALQQQHQQLKDKAQELAEALESVLPFLKAAGTNGNHWVPLVEEALSSWKEGKV